jgi:hypothetical protein
VLHLHLPLSLNLLTSAKPIQSNPTRLHSCFTTMPHTPRYTSLHFTSLPLYRAPRDRMATLNKHSSLPSALLILLLPVAWIKVFTQIEIVYSASSSSRKNSRPEFIQVIMKVFKKVVKSREAVMNISSYKISFSTSYC